MPSSSLSGDFSLGSADTMNVSLVSEYYIRATATTHIQRWMQDGWMHAAMHGKMPNSPVPTILVPFLARPEAVGALNSAWFRWLGYVLDRWP